MPLAQRGPREGTRGAERGLRGGKGRRDLYFQQSQVPVGHWPLDSRGRQSHPVTRNRVRESLMAKSNHIQTDDSQKGERAVEGREIVNGVYLWRSGMAGCRHSCTLKERRESMRVEKKTGLCGILRGKEREHH